MGEIEDHPGLRGTLQPGADLQDRLTAEVKAVVAMQPEAVESVQPNHAATTVAPWPHEFKQLTNYLRRLTRSGIFGI